MSLTVVLSQFNSSVQQCENLIVNAHKSDANGDTILPEIDQVQITVAGFLNMFIAWEYFLESSLLEYMTGSTTISGKQPKRIVFPTTKHSAQQLIIGINRYFDYANHQNIIKIANSFFEKGYPYEPHLSAIYKQLDDLRTMRNASAHYSTTTQVALDALAIRILKAPYNGINLYDLLTNSIPNESKTVFVGYKEKLTATAHLISYG